MSVSQKVALMHGNGVIAIDGVWLVKGHAELGIPGMHMLDGPRGLSSVSQVTGTAFPVASMRGATWNVELEREVGAAIARELRSVGADVLLAPTINVLRHPRWGRAQESYGEDAVHLGAMGVAFIEGAQSEGVIATAKHFAANSIEDTRFDVDVTVAEHALHEVYLPHFRRAVVDARVGAVMSAYNSVNGLHCDINPTLLTEILRERWGFAGLVMSDWVLGTHGDVEAVRAGLDVEMPGGPNFAALPGAVEGGEIELEMIDRSVRRILRAQFCFGLDTDPPVVDPSQRETEEHFDLAQQVAQQGLVLLTNDSTLPLRRPSIDRVVAMGPLLHVENIGDAGSSEVDVADVVTAHEGLVAAAGGVDIVAITSEVLTPDDEAAIAEADAVVLFAGLVGTDEGEGAIAAGDRASLELPEEHVALIEATLALGTPTIVVLEGGSAFVLGDWVDDASAVMMAWYPGVRGGDAIADLIFGDIEPSGRLPVSFPVAESDLPEFDNVSTSVTYGLLHGYRHLDAESTQPRFPFGHGLLYTTVTYDALTLDADAIGAGDTLVAHVELTNTGERPARETVQLYVSSPTAGTTHAPKDLRGFTQVELAPGESSSITIEIPAADLMHWSGSAWELEPGNAVVRVGPNARDLPLESTVTFVDD
jgi:beta-glucosidase